MQFLSELLQRVADPLAISKNKEHYIWQHGNSCIEEVQFFIFFVVWSVRNLLFVVFILFESDSLGDFAGKLCLSLR